MLAYIFVKRDVVGKCHWKYAVVTEVITVEMLFLKGENGIDG